MIHNLAAAAANCNTGTWQQKWNCGWSTPNPAAYQAGYNFGRALPFLILLALAFFVARAVRRRKKSRSAAPAGARR